MKIFAFEHVATATSAADDAATAAALVTALKLWNEQIGNALSP